jgi:O-antigen/teichoic acid export membrane protein
LFCELKAINRGKTRRKRKSEMKQVFSSLAKHSGIYALGQIVGRMASILLLPIYTRYLSPSDYGCVALIDLTTSMLGIVIGSGMASAVNRHHFESKDKAHQDRVWWTGLSFLALAASVVVLPALAGRRWVEAIVLGSDQRGGFLLSLALPTLWFGVISQLLETALRVRKWSTVFIAISLGRLFLNIALNLAMLIGMGFGVTGVLVGNLISGMFAALVMMGIFAATHGRCRIDRELIRPLLRFGSPLVITMLLGTMMHDADRYFLRIFMDVSQVGIYSLAYTIGMAVNTCYLAPFNSIWSVAIYEIRALPNHKQVYARVFELFADGLAWLILGVCLFCRPLLTWLVPRDFGAAADLVPVVCLAYYFFSLHTHFSVPVLLSKKTGLLLPANVAGALVNGLACLALIPAFGLAGAAWASVATFIVFSFVGLAIYRQVDRIDYPLIRCGLVLLGIMTTVGLAGWAQSHAAHPLTSAMLAITLWLGWGVALFGSLLHQGLLDRLIPRSCQNMLIRRPSRHEVRGYPVSAGSSICTPSCSETSLTGRSMITRFDPRSRISPTFGDRSPHSRRTD